LLGESTMAAAAAGARAAAAHFAAMNSESLAALIVPQIPGGPKQTWAAVSPVPVNETRAVS